MSNACKRLLAGVFGVLFFITALTSAAPTRAAIEAPITSELSGIKEINTFAADTNAATLDGDNNIYALVNTTNTGLLAFTACEILGQFVGCDIVDDEGNQRTSLVENMGRMIASMYYEPPATTERYLADVFNSMHIATPAYAQGIGFAALNPVLETWRIFRNLAYFLFVLIFLGIGFMIMFRQKVGQSAITAQMAIPNIIVALLAVTFSYAIAGLLIDGMYLLMYMIVGIFGVDSGTFINLGPFEFAFNLVKGGAHAGYDTVSQAIDNLLGIDGDSFGALGDLARQISVVGGVLSAAILAVAILVGVFRLFFELLSTYVKIILIITAGPLLLMMGALPGRNTFSTWVWSLIGNLAAFPTVLLALIIFDKLTGSITGSNVSPMSSGGFTPPYLFGLGGAEIVPFLIGLGILLSLTKIVTEVKSLLGAKSSFFEQFAQEALQSAKRGWTGAELIPGLGISNTANVGLSGRNINLSALSMLYGAQGALRGARRGASVDGAGSGGAFRGGFESATARAARRLGVKWLFPTIQQAQKKK